ncbi:hypothetical protein [Paenarthrobacter aurescens]|jgi:hypothetical protein|uniref:Lipoprotein n=1 Tax=Paenarthrobacter aurescens (strain TC1) TaxID=290340 RepID=A1R1I0_PAEAT|nr:hypothetical protein [Paenarthrobacter aurescens]ABM09083.1 putative lipoprotein [Paenarthrobacter aurescens TC1]
MKNKSLALVGAIVLSGLLLSGCSGAGSTGFQALEREATAADNPPEDLDLGEIHMEKILLVAEANGKKYYLGQGKQARPSCLIVESVDPYFWHSGCTDSIQGEMLRISGPDQKSAVLVSDDYDTKQLESSGLTKIHPNILVVTD